MTMKNFLMVLIGAMYLPTLQGTGVTRMGSIETSDYLILPLVGLLIFKKINRPRLSHHLLFPMILFIIWSFLGVASIIERYDYTGNHELYFSMVKLSKFVVYIFVGVLFLNTLKNDSSDNFHLRVVIFSALTMGFSFIYIYVTNQANPINTIAYENDNAVSVAAASTFVYLAARIINRIDSRRLRFIIYFSLLVLLIGALMSKGRGGWLSIIAAGMYIAYEKRRNARRIIAICLLFFVTALVMYNYNDQFHEQVEKLTMNDQDYVQSLRLAKGGVAGLDDGRRLTTWAEEAVHIFDTPIWGTGFFHRSGLTNLKPWGSHNYFIQLFLETGIVGGIILLVLLTRMWRISRTKIAREQKLDLPVRAALVAAIVGAMGGEYFYGGIALLNIIILFGAVGSLSEKRSFMLQKN